MSKEFKKLNDIASILLVQDNIKVKTIENMDTLSNNISSVSTKVNESIEAQNKILEAINNIDLSDLNSLENLTKSFQDYEINSKPIEINKLENINYTSNINESFEDILNSSHSYAYNNDISLENPIFNMMSNMELTYFSKDITEKYNLKDLDKDDIAFSAAAGVIAGFIDTFLVGTIKSKDTSGLQKFVDEKFDNIVCKYAKSERIAQYEKHLNNAKSEEGKKRILEKINDIKSRDLTKKESISILESLHHVSYDATRSQQITDGTIKGLHPNNHHLLSLAHSPSLIGLLVGVMDQLTEKTTFIGTDGIINRVKTTNKNEILGSSMWEKIINAITNWFGHLLSDIAGSEGSASKGNRGTGLPVPGWWILQKFQFGKININGNEKTIAEVSEWMFKNGYDVRAFTAQSIPIVIYEILVRLYWFYKQYFYYGKDFKSCLPVANEKNPDLSRMLLIAAGSFSTIDLSHATIKSKGFSDMGTFLLTINYPGLLDLGYRGYQNIKNNLKQRKRVTSIIEQNISEISFDIEEL